MEQNEAISEFAFNYRNNPFLLMLHSSFAEISNFKKLLKGLLKGFHGSIRLLCSKQISTCLFVPM
jgi:hypothetical protein